MYRIMASTIIYRIVETPFGNIEQTFGYFRELVLCHAVKVICYGLLLFMISIACHIRYTGLAHVFFLTSDSK